VGHDEVVTFAWRTARHPRIRYETAP